MIDSNIFKPGSSWEIRATASNAGSWVWRGRTVADHLRQFLSKLEQSGPR